MDRAKSFELSKVRSVIALASQTRGAAAPANICKAARVNKHVRARAAGIRNDNICEQPDEQGAIVTCERAPRTLADRGGP